ncbi:MAG: PRC-barrel domain-containing protein [Gemmatimonadaceae bacterium]
MTSPDRAKDFARGVRSESQLSQLLRVRELPNFAFGSARADVRGWPVYCSDAVLVGTVESILVDVRNRAVRYLGMALSDPETRSPTGTVLVPIGLASRPGDRHAVVLKTVSSADLATVPRVHARPVTRGDEEAVLATYGITMPRAARGGDFYARPAFSEHRVFGVSVLDDAEGESNG